MENYQFIKDEALLKEFYDNVVIPLKKDEVYFLMLSARKKYCDESIELRKGSDMLKRITLRKNNFDSFRNCILELFASVLVGCYRDKNDQPIPLNAFVVYMTTNPRNTRRACLGVVKKITEGLLNIETSLNLENIVMSEIHKTCIGKTYIDFDCDIGKKDDGEQVRLFIEKSLGESEFHSIKTRGGYHILLNVEKIDKKIKNNFYQTIKEYSFTLNDSEIEFKGKDNMIPIPGVTQGGFCPYIIS
jgi:hypothetical protein